MQKSVLVLNCGSSSLKFAFIPADNQPLSQGQGRLKGLAEKLGTPDACVSISYPDGTKASHVVAGATHSQMLQYLADTFDDYSPDVIGHRVVHGGKQFSASCLITPTVKDSIKANIALAPLHNPANLAGIEAAEQLFPSIPQVAVFDTAFHSTMPEVAYRYALPETCYSDLHIRRYGFHGTSHAYVSNKVAEVTNNSSLGLVTAHLGNGCSAAAVYQGKSLDTTMGFTPLEGLVMGTRSGDVDAGVIFYLTQQGYSVSDIDTMFNKKSGLLGLSGLSNDMRTLLAERDAGNSAATLALAVFCYRLAKHIAALAVALPQLDGIVFTGGIGENAAAIRAQTCALLNVLGVAIDTNLNQSAKGMANLAAANSRVALWVVPTDEEWQIAHEANALLA